jgi:hypothetical protein
MIRVLLIALPTALMDCSSAERTRNHERIATQGPPSRTAWAAIAVPGTLGWVYDPRSIARGDGKAFVWTRVPATNILVHYEFDCGRHVEAVGPIVTYRADTIIREDHRITDWDAITVDEEPLYRVACAGA